MSLSSSSPAGSAWVVAGISFCSAVSSTGSSGAVDSPGSRVADSSIALGSSVGDSFCSVASSAGCSEAGVSPGSDSADSGVSSDSSV